MLPCHFCGKWCPRGHCVPSFRYPWCWPERSWSQPLGTKFWTTIYACILQMAPILYLEFSFMEKQVVFAKNPWALGFSNRLFKQHWKVSLAEIKHGAKLSCAVQMELYFFIGIGQIRTGDVGLVAASVPQPFSTPGLLRFARMTAARPLDEQLHASLYLWLVIGWKNKLLPIGKLEKRKNLTYSARLPPVKRSSFAKSVQSQHPWVKPLKSILIWNLTHLPWDHLYPDVGYACVELLRPPPAVRHALKERDLCSRMQSRMHLGEKSVFRN